MSKLVDAVLILGNQPIRSAIPAGAYPLHSRAGVGSRHYIEATRDFLA
jgi:hypothetical protein